MVLCTTPWQAGDVKDPDSQAIFWGRPDFSNPNRKPGRGPSGGGRRAQPGIRKTGTSYDDPFSLSQKTSNRTLILTLGAMLALAAPLSAATYVGSSTCATCHNTNTNSSRVRFTRK